MARVALYTCGVLREPRGHEQVQGFVDRIESVFAGASAMSGFIALPPAMGIESLDDPTYVESRLIPEGRGAEVTLSLWRDLEAVFAYAYSGVHGEALRQRREWFIKPEWPSYTIWWVDDDHEPDWREAVERQLRLHADGPTPYAFTFHTPFDANGAPLPRVLAPLAIRASRDRGGA